MLSKAFTWTVGLNLAGWRRQWHPTPVLLPGKSHGWRSLVGCSPWGCEESDMTEWLHFHFSFSCIEEGNGNPLQYSCLENPGDRGAWWDAVYGVTQGQTQLKWLRSSSSSRSLKCSSSSLLPWQLTVLSQSFVALIETFSHLPSSPSFLYWPQGPVTM